MSDALERVGAVILAGGFGTRIRHLLADLPKPMAPVAGRPFVEWIVRYLAKQGIRRVVLSTGYLSETVERHFTAHPVAGVAVQCVAETTPLGTAGGFLHAIQGARMEAPAWLVLNGDSLALAELEGLIRCMGEPGVAAALVGVPMPDASRYGTLEVDATGGLKSFQEKRPGAGVINAGVYLFAASALELFPRRRPLSFETEVFPEVAARATRVKVCVTQAAFLDIGTPESLPLAEAFVRENGNWFQT